MKYVKINSVNSNMAILNRATLFFQNKVREQFSTAVDRAKKTIILQFGVPDHNYHGVDADTRREMRDGEFNTVKKLASDPKKFKSVRKSGNENIEIILTDSQFQGWDK